MVNYIFEHEDNRGTLTLTTHNCQNKIIDCQKAYTQTFRVGGTASNGLIIHPVTILSIDRTQNLVTVCLQSNPSIILVGSLYEFPGRQLFVNGTAFAIEYYTLDMEGKPPEWLITSAIPDQLEILFVNVDCIDSGLNIVKRYRVSTYTGQCKIMELGRGS